jgi:hypothetical protein
MPRVAECDDFAARGGVLEHVSTDTFCNRRSSCAAAQRRVLTFDQLAEHVIWAVLQPPAVDVNTIIFRRCTATI